MMKSMKWIIFVILAAFPALALAEFYRYVDEQGNVLYTDDLSSVPSDQLPKINEYKEANIQPVPKKQVETEKEEEGASKGSSKKGEEGAQEPDLRDRQAKLQAEFDMLTEERAQLEKAGQEPLTPETRRELDEKIKAFNERREDYRRRRESLNEEVEAYNASLKKEIPSPKAEEE